MERRRGLFIPLSLALSRQGRGNKCKSPHSRQGRGNKCRTPLSPGGRGVGGEGEEDKSQNEIFSRSLIPRFSQIERLGWAWFRV
ncbi:hypothetical protein GCM10008110_21530 [Marinobacter persicus]|nr:hypothetical protein GCM10008110_21530 [Marinobacter persicus]